MTAIDKGTMHFLKDLKSHNDRDWFNKNKDRSLSAHENFTRFVQELIGEVAGFDPSIESLEARDTMFRIYRDTRFSKDKSPYKTYLAATLLGKGKGCGIAGYYIHLEPGNTLLAGGVHMTEPADLKAIRKEISENGKAFLKILNAKSFKENLEIVGEKLVKVPQGFEKDDPMGDYLKYKQLMIHHHVKDQDVVSAGFLSYCAKTFKTMVPFNAFVNRPVVSMR